MASVLKRALLAGLVALAPVASAIAPIAAAQAHQYQAGPVLVDHPWARATPGAARTGAAYLTLVGGDAGDTLVGVETPAAARAELHRHVMENGVASMQKVDGGVTVAAHETVVFAPGGLHIMMFDLAAPLKEGTKVPMTLIFEKAGRVDVELAVQGAGAMGGGHGEAPADAGGEHSGHGG